MQIIIFCFILYHVCNVECWMSNVTKTDLPEIKEGQECIEGHMYRIDCNTCQCGENNALICTKMACLDKATMEKLKKKKESQKHSFRKGNVLRTVLPDLPKGKCEAGKTYNRGCEICYCNDKKEAICSKALCRMKLSSNHMIDPALLHEAFPIIGNMRLPDLPHMANECVPGKMYAIDCNRCFCTDSGDLKCSELLCVTPEGLANVDAFESSGKPCKEASTLQHKCVRCECINGITECKAIPKCKEQMKLVTEVSGKKKIKLSLDVKKKEKCTPKMIYRVHCNKCYCQEDGSLRCTVKTCLSHSEVKKLKNQRLYLEKYGL